ncbi:dolichyl-P-Man:Man(7)GlcNAc(2)-PP-dolichol alpha-1,6-mannosyltransferase [Aspergillus nanangensis]|uniref:Mannosyltransferase n=1 Tax=Aspergillus nanangensis TaxID=2582783 RepID=A0AAD4CSQ0_ASPNN|nr:dolichyl-P-Man:Man(7)GlcNAc(2)-PP-dolichol alpha-1,6-mannosyltransferase [Aspergillus nanangensis]
MGGIDVVHPFLLIAIPALILLHVVVAPYTKVEESFHIQAIHDILSHGIPTHNVTATLKAQYDHFTFPGAVPRTFVGALILSTLSRPFIWVNENVDKQFLARMILGLSNALALLSFASGLRRAFGKSTAVWYLFFQASQFHTMYYASRTLSNMFAFGMSTLALRLILPEPLAPEVSRKRCRAALCLLTIAGIIYRSELALFLGTNTLFLLFKGRVSIIGDIIPSGIAGVLIGLGLTVSVDSFFWQRFPLWPELAAFKFNVIHGQASAWGTHPWYFYFANAIPRLLLNPLTYLVGMPLALVQPSTRPAATYLLIPSLAFVSIFSFQPHKEWRFVIYVIPVLTAVSALGASYIWSHRAKSLIYRILSLAMVASTVASFLCSTFVLLPASSANYPGAHALNTLHGHADNTKPAISVYLGNLACQTGVTRFLQLPSAVDASIGDGVSTAWSYDKTENQDLKLSPSFWDQFDYVIVEPGEGETVLSVSKAQGAHWVDMEVIEGFSGVRFLRPGDAAVGTVERRVLGNFIGPWSVQLWETSRDLVRRTFTRGWWAELRMEPKLKIMQRV